MSNDRHARRTTHEPPDEGEIVRVTYTADVDRDKLEEYAKEHHPDADYVQIDDRVKADRLLFHGEKPGYICPECGREVHGITSSGGTRVYNHGIDDQCEWQDPEWEPSEYHPDHPSNQKPWWREWLATGIGLAIPIIVVLGVFHFMPESTISMNGESVPFPPDPLMVLPVLGLAALLVFLAMKYAPGMAGPRGRP